MSIQKLIDQTHSYMQTASEENLPTEISDAPANDATSENGVGQHMEEAANKDVSIVSGGKCEEPKTGAELIQHLMHMPVPYLQALLENVEIAQQKLSSGRTVSS